MIDLTHPPQHEYINTFSDTAVYQTKPALKNMRHPLNQYHGKKINQ
jgi:hypothetical protein